MNANNLKNPDAHRSSPAGHSVKCRCGTIAGKLVHTRSANRVICYCWDCQAFAHFLGDRQQVLDARGGSDIIQTLPKNLTITQGIDALACMRLTAKGTLRWYARCCRTPIGNTVANMKWSFIGLLHSFLHGDGVSLDEVFGPALAHVHTNGAIGSPKPQEVGRGKVGAWFLKNTLRARLNGDYKYTPLFSRDTGAPVATPKVLTDVQLGNLMEAVRASAVDDR